MDASRVAALGGIHPGAAVMADRLLDLPGIVAATASALEGRGRQLDLLATNPGAVPWTWHMRFCHSSGAV